MDEVELRVQVLCSEVVSLRDGVTVVSPCEEMMGFHFVDVEDLEYEVVVEDLDYEVEKVELESEMEVNRNTP